MRYSRWGLLVVLLLVLCAGLFWLFDLDRVGELSEGGWVQEPEDSLARIAVPDEEESAKQKELGVDSRESKSRLVVFAEGEGFASLSGRVLSASTRKGIAGARIQIGQPGIGIFTKGGIPKTLKAVVTDETGAWRCDNLEELSSIMFTINAEGYKESYHRIQLGQAELKLGNLYLDAIGAKVRIWVRDVEGRPIPEVRVRPRAVGPASMSNGAYSFLLDHKSPWVTDAAGQVLIPMEPGFHRFEIMEKEHVPLLSEVVEVRKGGPKSGPMELTYELQAGAPLRARVENQRGEPIAGAFVVARWGKSPWTCSRRSGEDGIVEFLSVPLKQPLYLITRSSHSKDRKLHLVSHPHKLIRIVLDEKFKATLRLTLVSESARGQDEPALVILARSGRDDLHQVKRFRFDQTSGTHELAIPSLGSLQGSARYQVVALSGGRYARSPFLQLAAGKTTDCRLVFREDSSCEIKVRVLDASRQPIANAWVRLYIPRHSEVWPGLSIPDGLKRMVDIVQGRSFGSYQALRGWRTDEKGAVQLYGLPDLDMRLLVEHPQHGHAVRTVPASRAGARLAYKIILADTGSVHGRVSSQGALPGGTYVHLEDEAGLLTLTASLREVGSYEFKGLPEGAYSLEARAASRRSGSDTIDRLGIWGAMAMARPSLAALSDRRRVYIRKGTRVRADLQLRNEIDEKSRVVRFEVKGMSGSEKGILEAIPMNQDFQRMFGPSRYRLELSPEGTISTRLSKGSYLVRVILAKQPSTLLAWKKLRVRATGTAKPQVFQLSRGKARLRLLNLSSRAKGIVSLRLIPELGSGAKLRRYGMEVEVIDAKEVLVEGVPNGLYRVELRVKGKKAPILLLDPVYVHGRVTTKRY